MHYISILLDQRSLASQICTISCKWDMTLPIPHNKDTNRIP